MSGTTWVLIVLAGLVMIGLLSPFFAWLRKQLGQTSSGLQTWQAYLKGQGIFLFFFLLLGAAVASAFVYIGPIRSEQPQKGGVLLEPRRVVLDEQHPIYTKRLGRVDQYGRITVFTRTTTERPTADPAGETPVAGAASSELAGVATITVHRNLGEGRNDEVRRIESTPEAWTRWEENNPKGEMSLIIESAGGTPARTIVELIVYFTPR